MSPSAQATRNGWVLAHHRRMPGRGARARGLELVVNEAVQRGSWIPVSAGPLRRFIEECGGGPGTT
jgi:hypothetical protein